MGQSNQPSLGQETNNLSPSKRLSRIFGYNQNNQNQKQKQVQPICERPNCKCPAKHVQLPNLKLCGACDNLTAPPIRKNQKLNYSKSFFEQKQHQQTKNKWNQASLQREEQIVEQVAPVNYYNAWSPPTQKYFVNSSIKHTKPTVVQQPMQPPQQQHYYEQHKPSLPVVENRPRPIPPPPKQIVINYENIDINNRMQNLFLFPD